MKNLFSYLNPAFLIVILLGLIIYSADFSFFENLENRFIDFRFQSRGAVEPDKRIIVVGLDQNTITGLNRPFFAYAPIYAKLCKIAREAKAAGILFDVVFPPGTEQIIKNHVKEAGERIGVEISHNLLRQLGFEKEFRAALLTLKRSSTALILGIAWEKDQAYVIDKVIERIADARNIGYFNLVTDSDGKIRKSLLFKETGDNKFFSVAYLGAKSLKPEILEKEELFSGYQLINFCGPRNTFKNISLIDLFEAEQENDELVKQLESKLLIVGYTDITDLKSTPVGFMPGPEVHANIVDNIVNNRFLPVVADFKILLLLLVLIILVRLLACRNLISAIVLTIIFICSWFIKATWFSPDYLLPVVRPLFLLSVMLLTDISLYMRRLYLERKRIRSVFERYVSDAVLKEILSATDKDFISGKRRRLCVLFADIRGFTSFSEKRKATEIVDFLNAYFARVSEIIMDHNGVVDKFLGDGILAFFNAPVEYPDYIDSAVTAAGKMLKFAGGEDFKKITGKVDLKIGIALHAGEVVFGNIGSNKKAEFTVIGDTVNACSRLESLNKEYGTSIIVSSDIVKQCQSGVKWKKLGNQQIRGKTEKIDIFTLA
jgi:adenylate cyclase